MNHWLQILAFFPSFGHQHNGKLAPEVLLSFYWQSLRPRISQDTSFIRRPAGYKSTRVLSLLPLPCTPFL
ncbi:hypothetical protein AV530_010308 [Patagioenas fasciata monilis]|uniref:Uncharacterized protein n=1 Tax=Patagioenas fasciata monilis TaxID=372326 RepID=A0A1V4KEJ0_PATFA|nr:hypothetical protein AV530_010308 [Patagioenas fasciata monilis]